MVSVTTFLEGFDSGETFISGGFLSLTGTIPTTVARFSQLGALLLNSNQISGSIPSVIGELTSLQLLWLDDNRLTGTIPRDIGNLAAMQILLLNSNELTGPIPRELSQLGNMISSSFGFNEGLCLEGGMDVESMTDTDAGLYQLCEGETNVPTVSPSLLPTIAPTPAPVPTPEPTPLPTLDVPSGWTCQPVYYNANDGCDCQCGAYDPDCGFPEQGIWGCSDGAIGCSDTFECVYPDDDGSETPDIELPEEWTCPAAYFNANDGCDCQCGASDPDCDDPNQVIWNCADDAIGCSDTFECVYPGDNSTPDIEEPEEWACPAEYFNANDGCDCECGVHDPDCDLPDQVLYGCNYEAIGCSDTSECVYP